MNERMMLTPSSNVALLGFGAKAVRLAAILAPRGTAMRAWDPSLAGEDGGQLRAGIEAAGVDCMADLAAALRGARLVVLDTLPMTRTLAAQLQGRQVLDLSSATPAEVDAVLAALGVPPFAPRWETASTAPPRTVANSAATTLGTPSVRRGELP